MAQVFISYASENADAARAVAAALAARGIGIWIAPDSIAPGQIYNEAIVAGLRASDALCVLVSQAANASKHVAREVALADDLSKRIVPVRIEPIEPSDGLVYYLQLPQWVEWHAHGPAALEPVIALLSGGAPATPPPQQPPIMPPPIAPPPAAGMARLEIRRGKSPLGMLRNFAILLDGAKVGEIGNGGVFQLNAPSGRHEIVARVDWVTSPPLALDLQPGRARVVQLGYNGLSFSWTQIE